MTTHFDNFRSLKEEIEDIKSDLKSQNRRITPPVGTRIAYRMIKQISSPISKVFNYKRYSYETSVEMFKTAVVKLDLLVKELFACGRESLAETLQHIYRRLFNLLPQNTVIQCELFISECYQINSKKTPVTRGFLKWVKDYVNLGYKSCDIARKRAYQPIRVIQWSIRFSGS